VWLCSSSPFKKEEDSCREKNMGALLLFLELFNGESPLGNRLSDSFGGMAVWLMVE